MTIKRIDQSHVAARSIFYVEGEITGGPGRQHMKNQMYVEAYFPQKQTHPRPLVFFHGAGQTCVSWLTTPDGRMGWADYFVSQGWAVYLCEQPSRGRSAYHPDDNGPRTYHSLESLQRYMAPAGDWPQAARHTQWPGAGSLTSPDETDRQFLASQVEYLPKKAEVQRLVKECGLKLLAETGPAVLLTHSQAGAFGWILADEAPELVKGIVAIEPAGPPFSEDLTRSSAENYGIAELPLHFVPPVKNPEELRLALLPAPNPEQDPGWVPAEPAPRLPRLAGIPIWIITGEASYHAAYDHLTSAFLSRCAVEHDFIRLEEHGIYGNGHMMMQEKNNLRIAALIAQMLTEKGL